jgi:acyl-CoA reductase-like NAD-dependent aldehyde dehydrogenase
MVFRRVLARRGWNPNLVQIITGQGATGAALTTCGVDKMLFIGSPQVGTLVMRAASERMYTSFICYYAPRMLPLHV